MAVDITTLGWGTVQDKFGNALTGRAFTITDADSVVVLSGTTDAQGQIVGTIAHGIYTLSVTGISNKTVQAIDVSSVVSTSQIHLNVDDLVSGLDKTGASAMETVLNNAIIAASAVGAARGTRVRLVAPPSYLRLDQRLRLKPWVDLDLTDSYVFLGADLTSTTPMVNTEDTLGSVTARGTGTTVNGSYVITSVSAPLSWAPGDKITGTGIAAGTRVLYVDPVSSKIVLDTAATASNSGVTLSLPATYYGTYKNCGLIGGTFDPNGHICGHIIRALFTDNFTLEGTLALHNRAAGENGFAYLVGGRNMRAEAPECRGGSRTFEDGFHFLHGQGLRLGDGYFESGDDAIAIGGQNASSALLADPDPIRDVQVTDCEVRSLRAHALAVFVESGNTGTGFEITDVTVRGLKGYAGIMSNGPIRVQDENASAAGTSQITGVTVEDFDLKMGSKAHDDAAVTPAIKVSSASAVRLRGKVTMTEPAGVANGYRLLDVLKSYDVDASLHCPQLGTDFGITAQETDLTRLHHCNLEAAGAAAAIWFNKAKRLYIEDNQIPVTTSVKGIISSAVSGGRTSFGRIRRNRFNGDGSNGIAMDLPLDSNVYFNVDDNDFTTVSSPLNNEATIRLGSSTLTTATATAAGTSITVADSSIAQNDDLIFIPRTREVMKVSGIPDATHINVFRGRMGTTALAIVSGEQVVVQRLFARGNRAMQELRARADIDVEDGQISKFATIPAVGTQAAATGDERLMRWVAPRDMAITGLRLTVTAWTAGDTADPACEVAIYDGALAQLGTSGSVTGKLNATGSRNVALTSTLNVRRGTVLYFGIHIGTLGTSTVSLASMQLGSVQTRLHFGTTAPQVMTDVKTGATAGAALPNPWVLTGASNVAFILTPVET
jgi:hypothetical protein